MSLDDFIARQGIPPLRSSKKTRAEELRKQLADEIVLGLRAPGSALDETVLALQFSVSRTPVREALRLLAASGLVDHRAHRGAVVARPSVAQFNDMIEAMIELESMCAGFAAVRMNAADRRALEARNNDMRRLCLTGNVEGFLKINDAFHRAIAEGGGNAYLAEMAMATSTRMQPFRLARPRDIDRIVQGQAEHEAIVDGILSGNRKTAADAMRTHMEHMRGGFELPPRPR